MDIYNDPILTARDTARHLKMPESTLNVWLRAAPGVEPLVHSVPARRRGWPRVPFAGVIEAHVLRELRDGLGIRMDEIRRIAEILRAELDDPFALASQRISTDGFGLFAELADESLVDQHGQAPIREVLEGYLRPIRWDDQGKPLRLRLEQYPQGAEVIIDPRFAWGNPVIEASKTPVAAVVDLWLAGESMDEVAAEFDLPRDVVEDVCRVGAA